MISTQAQTTLKIAEQMLVDLDTPISLSIYILMQDGSEEAWDQIFGYEFCPTHYTEAATDQARRDLCAISLLSKVPNFLGRPLRDKAVEAFERGEQGCRATNERILATWHDSDFDLVSDQLVRVLGKAPSLQFCFHASDFGPGASATLNRERASADVKACFETSVTLDCARALARECTWPVDLAERTFTLLPGNIVSTAPKNAKTDRTIAIESGITSRVQKGIGGSIRGKLRRFGVDLNDQTLNQRAALTALRYKRATLDLKNASGSIASLLVYRLLSQAADWFDLLYLARSHRYTYDERAAAVKGTAEWHEYQCWSSMGNGYTFELESAIFLAICLAAEVPLDQLYIYGDDIIVPQDKSDRVTALLQKCGFELNPSKSFTDGLFFESCGVYTFNGCDVTPVKIKDYVHDVPHAIVLANKLRAFSALDRFFTLDRRYLPTYRMCVDAVRDCCFVSLLRKDRKRSRKDGKPLSSKRKLTREAERMLASLRGPIGVEGCLHSHVDEARPKYSRKRGGLAFNVVAYRERTRATDVQALQSRRESQIVGARSPLSSDAMRPAAKLTLTGHGLLVLPCFIEAPRWQGNVVKTLTSRDTTLYRTCTEQWTNALRW